MGEPGHESPLAAAPKWDLEWGGGGWSQGKAGKNWEKLGKASSSRQHGVQLVGKTVCLPKNAVFWRRRGMEPFQELPREGGGLADGFWGLGGMLRQQMSKIQRRAAFWGKGVGVWGQSGHLKEKKKIFFISRFCKLSWKGTESRCVCVPAEAAGLGAHRDLCFPKLDVNPPFPAFLRQFWAPHNFSRCWERPLCPWGTSACTL